MHEMTHLYEWIFYSNTLPYLQYKKIILNKQKLLQISDKIVAINLKLILFLLFALHRVGFRCGIQDHAHDFIVKLAFHCKGGTVSVMLTKADYQSHRKKICFLHMRS